MIGEFQKKGSYRLYRLNFYKNTYETPKKYIPVLKCFLYGESIVSTVSNTKANPQRLRTDQLPDANYALASSTFSKSSLTDMPNKPRPRIP